MSEQTSTAARAGIGDLGDSIDRVKCHGLNISAGKPIMNLFIGDERVSPPSREAARGTPARRARVSRA